jgi:hypothetical protein
MAQPCWLRARLAEAALAAAALPVRCQPRRSHQAQAACPAGRARLELALERREVHAQSAAISAQCARGPYGPHGAGEVGCEV